MNHLSAAAMAFLLFFTGCIVSDTPMEDSRRLEGIDQRINDGEFEYAKKESKKYVQEYPNSFKGWGLLGWAYLKTDELETAQECFDKSLSINPQWDNAHVGKGVMYRKMGDIENARKSYLKAISILPDNAESFSSLLVIELMEGNDKKAVEYGEKAWALRKDSANIPANLSVAYHYRGDTSNRDKFFEHAKRLGYYRLQALKDIFDGKTGIR